MRVVSGTLLLGMGCGCLAGCGGALPPCSLVPLTSVGPAAASADHLAKAPGNQQQFQASVSYGESRPGCAVPLPALAFLEQVDWTVSDPMNVQISSAKDATNGLATCVGATSGPVVVTAVGTAATATLLCK